MVRVLVLVEGLSMTIGVSSSMLMVGISPPVPFTIITPVSFSLSVYALEITLL